MSVHCLMECLAFGECRMVFMMFRNFLMVASDAVSVVRDRVGYQWVGGRRCNLGARILVTSSVCCGNGGTVGVTFSTLGDGIGTLGDVGIVFGCCQLIG